MMNHLQPRHEHAGTVLIEELESVLEVIFILDGQIEIGYEINKKDVAVWRNPTHSAAMIGAYNCTFNKRAIFFYRVVKDIKGYYITKRNWRDLLDAYPTISENFKRNVIEDYS